MIRTSRAYAALVAGGLCAVLAGCAGADETTGTEPAGTEPTAAGAGGAALTAPAQDAAAWLAGRLDGGVIEGQYGPDYGLSIDAAVGLAELDGVEEGRYAAPVTAVADAVAAHLDSYTTGADFGAADDVYAGSVAKAAVMTQVAGGDATDVGGTDLIELLEDRVADAGPAAGRLSDQVVSADGADYANTVGQAWAVQALRTAGSPEADAATAYLLDQQCADGWFRLELGPADGAGTCAEGGKSSLPDTDATALAVLALTAGTGEEPEEGAAADAVEAAVAWLARTQEADGGFGGATSTEGSNANSTGLAVRALVRGERCEEAGAGARWIEQLQRGNGAIAYDPASAQSPIRGATRDQWVRATAQATPALLYLDGC